jgi:DNA-binding LytR/AlgR family response regulator
MKKSHILIVEDEWIIYDDLATFLTTIGFTVAPYTKNYSDAIAHIKTQLPDIVLLDIDLNEEKDGIDLGEKLSSTYHIPFIYLSAFTDKLTLKRARRTQPETFLIKTKPQIDKEQLAVSIQMVLEKKQTTNESAHQIEGIMAYTNYYRDAINKKSDDALKTLCLFENVLWIETDIAKRNYLILHSTNKNTAYYKSSLAQIKQLLPFHFVRINTSQIVNLKQVIGKINHSSFTIGNENFKIGKNYTVEVHKVLHQFYAE